MLDGWDQFKLRFAVIGSRRPLRSDSLATFIEVNSIELLEHPDPYFSADEPRVGFTDDRAARDLWGRRLSLGEIGCHWSHRHAYQAALSCNADWLIVFEDDVRLFPGFPNGLTALLEALKDRRDPVIVNLDLRESESKFQPESRSFEPADMNTLLLSIPFPEPNASAYLINKCALELAMRTPWQVACPPDWPPWAFSVEFMTTRVRLAQAPNESTILGRDGSPPMTNRVRRLLMGVSGLNWLLHRDQYLDGENYFEYEFRFRARQSIKAPFTRSWWVSRGLSELP